MKLELRLTNEGVIIVGLKSVVHRQWTHLYYVSRSLGKDYQAISVEADEELTEEYILDSLVEDGIYFIEAVESFRVTQGDVIPTYRESI